MNFQNIVIHHFGPTGADRYSKSGYLSVRQVDEAHRVRWQNYAYSSMGSFVGYHFIILPNGDWVQTRRIGEESVAVRGRNFDTISIALAGNFTKLPNGEPVEEPTPAQVNSLKKLCYALIMNRPDWADIKIAQGAVLNIKVGGIVPHRALQPDTDCFGDFLPNNWGQTVMKTEIQEKITLLTQLVTLYQKLLSLLQRKPVGGVKIPCGELDVKG